MFQCFPEWVWKFSQDTRGATAIEYAMLAAGIAVAIIAAVMSLSGTLGITFNDLDSAM